MARTGLRDDRDPDEEIDVQSPPPPAPHPAFHGPRRLMGRRVPDDAPMLLVDAVSVFGGVDIKHEK